jgi:hypothetical protein
MVLAANSGEDGQMNAQAASGSLRCEIEVEELGSGVQLQGMVFAKQGGHGSYQLQVRISSGGGSSNIIQSGEFSAQANAPTRLGVIQLGGDGGSYDAQLKVFWDGEEIVCRKKIGGGWL